MHIYWWHETVRSRFFLTFCMSYIHINYRRGTLFTAITRTWLNYQGERCTGPERYGVNTCKILRFDLRKTCAYSLFTTISIFTNSDNSECLAVIYYFLSLTHFEFYIQVKHMVVMILFSFIIYAFLKFMLCMWYLNLLPQS